MRTPRYSDYIDVEKSVGTENAHLTNRTVRSFAWENITQTVKDRQSGAPKDILYNVSGLANAGTSN
jgi:hypothetical protein